MTVFRIRRLAAHPSRRVMALAAAVLTGTGLVATVASSAAATPAPAHQQANDTPVVLYSSDGMRPDLMQRYATQGLDADVRIADA